MTMYTGTQLMITDLGGGNFQLKIGNARQYISITATAGQLDHWTTEIRSVIGPARPRPYVSGDTYVHGRGADPL